MELSAQIIQYLFTGLTLGGIYALIALGFVIIYTVTGHINFAQGEFVMLGALITVSLFGTSVTGLPLLAAALSAVVIVGVFGCIFERAVFNPARNSSIVTVIIITLGASIAIRGTALLIWGSSSYFIPSFGPFYSFKFMGASMSFQTIWVLAVSIAVVTVLFLFFERTLTGKALKACAVNRLAASLMGISPGRMSLLSFLMSAVIGAAAGIVIAPITTATYDMGLMLGLKGFVAAVFGGLNSVTGAVIGGFVLGICEAMGAGLLSSGYKDAIAFIVLLIVLFKFPSGIMAKSAGKRV